MAKKLTKAEEAKLVAQRLAKTDEADDVRGKVKAAGDEARASSAKQDKRISARDKSGKSTDAAKVEAATPRTKRGAPSAVDASAVDTSLMDAPPATAPTVTPKGKTEKSAAANRRSAERTAGRKMTGEEATAQGLLEKDFAELQRQSRREARQRDADVEGRDLAEEARQRRLAREETPAATVADPEAGNAAALEHLSANMPGGRNFPLVAGAATSAIDARTGSNAGFPIEGASGSRDFDTLGAPQAKSPETADDTHISDLIRSIRQEGAKRTVNKGTLAQLKSQLSMVQDMPPKTPGVCPHSGCTNIIPWDNWAEVQDQDHPDYDAAYGSVACDSCKSKGLKSGNQLPHLQSFTRRGGNPGQTDFFNASNY
jgi:hypothetical protein